MSGTQDKYNLRRNEDGLFGAKPASTASAPKAAGVKPPTSGPKGPAGNSGASKT